MNNSFAQDVFNAIGVLMVVLITVVIRVIGFLIKWTVILVLGLLLLGILIQTR